MSLELDTRNVPREQDELTSANDAACAALYRTQNADGHWCYELEADATIPAEYVLLRHYRGEPVDAELERKIAVYLRRIQSPKHGGWPLFHAGEFDISSTLKAYFALKTIGDDIDAPHMQRAREAILTRGGAKHVNVFTRILLALFGIMSWDAVPMMPVEITLLPRWFPFHLTKISYWGRTVLIPLLVLFALKPRAKNPKGITLDELFTAPPLSIGAAEKAPHQNAAIFAFFRGVDVILRKLFNDPPEKQRQRAIEKAVAFVDERLNGKQGLGAIFPAMVNATMMYDALGGPENARKAAIARDSVERLLVVKDGEAYCQPCVSPVWDSVLAAQALLEVGTPDAIASAKKALDWLVPLQVSDVVGDWCARAPHLRPGGWAFQYSNPHYPDLDDTAVVMMAMDRLRKLSGTRDYDAALARAEEWVRGMQSRNGGWAAFDIDNTHEYLNNIPFADHGALVDPPTEDVGARCVCALAQLGAKPDDPAIKRGIAYLLREQMDEGSWYGRWGVNYIYGTWSVLNALNAAGLPHAHPAIRKAVNWLVSIQNEDGGWGEDCDSYKLAYRGYEKAPSTSSQTAWALIALMAVGEVEHPTVPRGIRYLIEMQSDDGFWNEELYTGTGFPRVFYLRYHGYRKYFPLWALARYRSLNGKGQRFRFGM
jgi:squalene-hopene/tetraprenyl-beta-curcumene cyclase